MKKSEIEELIKEINFEKEENVITKVLKIEGMMCSHCEARVKKTLEAVDEVESVVVSLSSDSATVILSKPIDDSVLRSAVEAQGYKVVSIE